MSTALTETMVTFGREAARFFSPACTPGDWNSWTVSFSNPFPSDDVRVVACGSDEGVDAGLHRCAPVAVTGGVNSKGFDLHARNSDCAAGSAGMHWIAVCETPGQTSNQPIDLRTLLLQPRFFEYACKAGDWQDWPVRFTRPLVGRNPVAVVTARKLPGLVNRWELLAGTAVFAIGGHRSGQVVGVVDRVGVSGLSVAGRNSEGWNGISAMNGIAVSDAASSDTDIVIASGVTGPANFGPYGVGPLGKVWEIQFDLPFLTAPIVLATATDFGVTSGVQTIAAVATVEDVTTHGFTLMAFNTDCASGQAAFMWVAIGCGFGCASGTAR